MDKSDLRKQLKKSLLEISAQQRAEKSSLACQKLIATDEFAKAATVMMYMPLPHEADVSGAILYAWQQGKVVAVPKVSWEQRRMIAVEINSLEKDFSTEVAGLRNPVTGVPVPFEDIELVVTPGLGFDKVGNRLGRGGGYYDSFLGNEVLQAAKCGFAFAEQIVESVPVEPKDVSMDLLVTDKEVRYFGAD